MVLDTVMEMPPQGPQVGGVESHTDFGEAAPGSRLGDLVSDATSQPQWLLVDLILSSEPQGQPPAAPGWGPMTVWKV